MRITREQLIKGESGTLTKEYGATIASVDDRRITYVISTADVDRVGDSIKQTGIQTKNYLCNPVVMLFHDYKDWPVGKCVEIGIIDGNLTATVEFIAADVPLAGQRAECAYQLSKNNFLNAVSIGFNAIAWKYNDERDGIDYNDIDLTEFSLVPVPCNPFALRIEDEKQVNQRRSINTNDIAEKNKIFSDAIILAINPAWQAKK